ncbi:MAG: monofunctional biosynthetic peptidoglycan transglycosylase [Gammaproteobacteria bacterium]
MTRRRSSCYSLTAKPHAIRRTFSGRVARVLTYALLAAIFVSISAVVILRYLPAPTSAFMLQKQFGDWFAGNNKREVNYRWINRSKISKHAFTAVIAAEDQRFYEHHGFDFDAIYNAYQRNMRGGKVRGGSTISQQVAKNLFLTPTKSLARKVLEAWFTLLIECFWSKPRILEMYLNIAEFGDHLYGVEAASQRYFGIPARKLSASQAALLAATLPNPNILKANKPSSYLLHRQNWILQQMPLIHR